MSNKKKTVEQIVKLWLDEYLDQLDRAELYSLISELCDKIYELDEGE